MEATTSSVMAEETVVRFDDGEELLQDSFFYLCGRVLTKRPVNVSSLSATISAVWRLKERVLIREEEEGILVFQF
ncbi:hypothetical protein ACLB2K_014888 [Fragaria x ananassa]